MAIKVIPISSERSPVPGFEGGTRRDSLGRSMHDLRISVTDRCNFRCVYCMPREVFDANYTFLPHSAILSFEEIARLARIFVGLGVEKIRLTGGEPLVRRDLHRLVAMLKELDVELTLTTNGSLLARNAQALAGAGLGRVTVRPDSLRRRRRRDRRHLVGHAGLLRQLHADAAVDRGRALHVPVRAVGPRPEVARARRRLGRGDSRPDRRGVAAAGGSLFGNSDRGHLESPKSRDVLHRWLSTDRS